MKNFKKIVLIVSITAMLLTLGIQSVVQETIMIPEAKTVIEQYITALDCQDWPSIISMSPTEEYDEDIEFYYSVENKENGIGFHAITSASITTLVELDSSALYDYTNADYYFEQYEDLKLYLLGVNLSVDKESKYFYNGVNFFLVTLGQEQDAWKVVLFSQAPASIIEHTLTTT